MSTTWFITGASRGLGRELTEQVLARGDRVAATLRTPSQLDDLTAAHGDRLWMRQLDVTDTVRMGRVVEDAFTDHERIDVMVSNAGFGVFGAAEDLTNDQVEQMIATNLTAAIHLARLVVPYLRRQGGGRLMQLSSMGGHIAFPAFSLYHATKWGMEGFYEALAQEVEPFGIHTTLVEPGMIRTSFYEAATRIPVSEPYQGGPADRTPIPLEQMPGSQAKVVAAMTRQRCLRTHRAVSCSGQTPIAWSPMHSQTDWQPSSGKGPSRSRRTLTKAKTHHDQCVL